MKGNDSIIKVTVKDHDTFGKDEIEGVVWIRLSSKLLQSQVPVDMDFKLKPEMYYT